MKRVVLRRNQKKLLPATVCLFVLFVALSCSEPNRLHAVRSQDGIEILEGNQKVLFYQAKPKSLNGRYERAHYVHPLYSLGGNVITEDFPEDHPHHHGIFSAWHQIIVNGEPVADGWTSDNLAWDVVDATVTTQGETITIVSEVLWRSSVNGTQIQPLVRENSRITVHPSDNQLRVIDFDLHLSPLRDSIMIGGSADEKGYGGFSLRLKLPENIRFVARTGEVQPQVLGVEAGPWMDFIGSFDGPQSAGGGVLVFSHPSNPGHPQPWILRDEKSMQNPAFPGSSAVDVTKEGIALRYRVLIHKDQLDLRAIEELYQHYAGS